MNSQTVISFLQSDPRFNSRTLGAIAKGTSGDIPAVLGALKEDPSAFRVEFASSGRILISLANRD